MTSNSLRIKIARMQEAAQYELPKARLCAHVVLTSVDPADDQVAGEAIASLKSGLGSNWSETTAFQYMSGRQAEFSAACGDINERSLLYLAHLIAKEVCHVGGLSGAARPDGIDLAKFRALVDERLASEK